VLSRKRWPPSGKTKTYKEKAHARLHKPREPETLKIETPENDSINIDINDRNFFYHKYQEMLAHAEKLANQIWCHDLIKVISHIDADGITSGAVAAKALEKVGKEWTIQFEKQLDPMVIGKLQEAYKKDQGDGTRVLYWFTDFGTGQLKELEGINLIITDHHTPNVEEPADEGGEKSTDELNGGTAGETGESAGPEPRLSGQTRLFDFDDMETRSRKTVVRKPRPLSEQERMKRELNPHFFGLSGADHISGAGVTYLLAKVLHDENEELAPLAVVGAVGDLQATRHCRLVGLNEFIVEDAERHGLKASYDIRSFGRETRPVYKLLQYTNDPIIPSMTGDQGNCMAFMVFNKEPLAEGRGAEEKDLSKLDLASFYEGDGRKWRKWVDLEWEAKQKLLSNLVKHLLYSGLELEAVLRLLGEVYVLEREERYSPLRDAKEFATLLNACGRYGNADIGFNVCRGDRGRYLEKALLLLKGHRRVLVDNIKYVKDSGVTEMDYIQFFHGKDVIPENVVGIVAGMVLGSGEVNENLPIIGFTNASEGVKVSARTVRKVVRKGVNLARALNRASKEVGGGGGGHNIAAGAHVPEGKEKEFLKILEEIIKEQLGN